MNAFLTLAALTLVAAAPAPDPVSPAALSADVKVLASDAFAGRAPGTEGETRTVDWLIAQFKAAGLQPGGPDGSWTQAVPLIRTLHERADALRAAELERARRMLARGDAPEAVLEALSTGLTNKFLHGPKAMLARGAIDAADAARLVEHWLPRAPSDA